MNWFRYFKFITGIPLSSFLKTKKSVLKNWPSSGSTEAIAPLLNNSSISLLIITVSFYGTLLRLLKWDFGKVLIKVVSFDQNFSNFINACNTVLDKQLPKKKKYVRGNQSPFMNKTLSKAIMLRTNPRNKFLKNRSNENKTNYVKQRNHCVSLLRKTKREYYSNLDGKKICDNKTFWN